MRHSSKEIQTALEAAQEEYTESEVIVKWLGSAQAVDVLGDVLEENPTWDVTQAIRHVIDSASEEDFTEDLHRWGINRAGTVHAPVATLVAKPEPIPLTVTEHVEQAIKPREGYRRLPADRYHFTCRGVGIYVALMGDQSQDRYDVWEGYTGEWAGERVVHVKDVPFKEAEKVMLETILRKFEEGCTFVGYKLGVYGQTPAEVRQYAGKKGYTLGNPGHNPGNSLKQRIRQKIESFEPKGANQEEFLDRIRWALEHWTTEELPEHIMGNIDIYNRHVGRGGRMGTLFKELEGILRGRASEEEEHINYIVRESKDRVPAPPPEEREMLDPMWAKATKELREASAAKMAGKDEPFLGRSIDPGLYRWWKEFVQYQGGRGYLTKYEFEEGSTLTTVPGDWEHFRRWLNAPRSGAPPAREVIDYIEFLAPYDSTTYATFEREFLSRGYVKGHLWELVKTLADEQMLGLEKIQGTWYISRITKCTVCGLQTEGELKHEGRVICKSCLARKEPVEYEEFRSAVQEKLVPGPRQLEFAVAPEPKKRPARRRGPPPKTAVETDLSRWGEMPGKPRLASFGDDRIGKLFRERGKTPTRCPECFRAAKSKVCKVHGEVEPTDIRKMFTDPEVMRRVKDHYSAFLRVEAEPKGFKTARDYIEDMRRRGDSPDLVKFYETYVLIEELLEKGD